MKKTIGALLLLLALLTAIPAGAATVKYGKKAVTTSTLAEAVAGTDEPYVTPDSTNTFTFTLVPEEGEDTLVIDLAGVPSRVRVKSGTATLYNVAPASGQMTFDLSEADPDEKLYVIVKTSSSQHLTVHTLDTMPAAEAENAIVWEEAETASTMLLLAEADDLAACTELLSRDGVQLIVAQKLSAAEQDALLHTAWNAGLRRVPVFLGLTASAKESELRDKWLAKTVLSKLTTRVRDLAPETVAFCAADETKHTILAEMARTAVERAADIEDEGYTKAESCVWQVTTLTDITAGEDIPLDVVDQRALLLEEWGEAIEPEIPGLPETNEQGFLTADDEFVYINEDDGVWFYLSDTLRVTVTRHNRTGKYPLIWYEADIVADTAAGETLKVQSADKAYAADKLAKMFGQVIAINADFYAARPATGACPAGLIIRGGEVLYSLKKEVSSTGMPPLDTLMLTADGTFRVDETNELTAEEALEAGATDVMSFGPILVKDGRLRFSLCGNRTAREPRTSIGAYENGHYLIIVAEGRQPGKTVGITLLELAELYYLRGVDAAFNMDGGQTSAFYFLGERLNAIGNHRSSGLTRPRNQRELLGIGYSELALADE